MTTTTMMVYHVHVADVVVVSIWIDALCIAMAIQWIVDNAARWPLLIRAVQLLCVVRRQLNNGGSWGGHLADVVWGRYLTFVQVKYPLRHDLILWRQRFFPLSLEWFPLYFSPPHWMMINHYKVANTLLCFTSPHGVLQDFWAHSDPLSQRIPIDSFTPLKHW